MFHYPPNVLHTSGRWWRERVHPDDRQRLRDGLEETVGSKLVHLSANYRFRTADNKYKFVYDRAYVICNDGKPVRVIGAMQDIDALMNATDQIRKLSMVASKTNNVVIITNTSQKIEWVNEAFTRVTGYTIDEVIGRPPSEVLREPGIDLSVIQNIHKKLERFESVDAEILYYSKAGKKIWFKLNINPVLNDQGTLLIYVSVPTNVTPLKDYEARLTAIARYVPDENLFNTIKDHGL